MRYGLIIGATLMISGAALAAPETSFQSEAARSCPARNLGQMPPANLLDIADGYRSTLSVKVRHRLDALLHKRGDNGAIGVCTEHNGASCDVHAYLSAFERFHLTGQFVHAACNS